MGRQGGKRPIANLFLPNDREAAVIELQLDHATDHSRASGMLRRDHGKAILRGL